MPRDDDAGPLAPRPRSGHGPLEEKRGRQNEGANRRMSDAGFDLGGGVAWCAGRDHPGSWDLAVPLSAVRRIGDLDPGPGAPASDDGETSQPWLAPPWRSSFVGTTEAVRHYLEVHWGGRRGFLGVPAKVEVSAAPDLMATPAPRWVATYLHALGFVGLVRRDARVAYVVAPAALFGATW